MFRKTVWRNTVSDAVSFHQDQALNTTIFLLKSYGPTGFLLREDGNTRNFKVTLAVFKDIMKLPTKFCPFFSISNIKNRIMDVGSDLQSYMVFFTGVLG